MGYKRATRTAASIGQVLVVNFGFLGLFGNPLLVLVAIFIFLAASGEAGYVQAREYTRGYLAGHTMITSFELLGPLATADDAAALLLRTTQQEIPVVDGAGTLRGVVRREVLIDALREKGGSTPVIEIMDRDVPTVPENACLDNIFQQMQQSRARVIAVVDPSKRFVGYITPDNLSELVMIQSSRSARREAASA